MKKILLSFVVIWIACVFAGTAGESVQRRKFVSTGENVNIRARALLTSEVVGQLDMGEEVLVKGSEGDWYEIVPPFKIDLWVYSDFITDGMVTSPKVNVRAGPGINFSIVGQLIKGDAVVVRGHSADWVNIEPPEKCSLWVASSLLEPVAEQPVLTTQEESVPETVPDDPAPEPVELVDEPAPVEAVEEVETETDAPPDVSEPVVDSEPTDVEDESDELVAEEEPEPDEHVVEKEVVAEKDVPSTPAPEPKPVKPPEDMDLVPLQQQGNVNTYTGILRTPAYLFNRPSQFRIVEYTESGERITRCYVKGNTPQLRALLGRKMTVTGREYWVQGSRYPVLVPERIVVEY